MTPLMIALLLTSAPTGAPVRRYFPPQTATHDCRYGDRVRTVPLVDENWLTSYTTLLTPAHEPSLLAPRADGTTILRFTWVRTFHAPVIIRLTLPRRGRGHIDMIRFSGLGGYDYGQVKDRRRRAVSREDASALLEGIDPALLVPATPSCGPPGLDGARWLIERSDASGYHLADRWSPRDGVVRRAGLALIALAGLEDEKIY